VVCHAFCPEDLVYFLSTGSKKSHRYATVALMHTFIHTLTHTNTHTPRSHNQSQLVGWLLERDMLTSNWQLASIKHTPRNTPSCTMQICELSACSQFTSFPISHSITFLCCLQNVIAYKKYKYKANQAQGMTAKSVGTANAFNAKHALLAANSLNCSR